MLNALDCSTAQLNNVLQQQWHLKAPLPPRSTVERGSGCPGSGSVLVSALRLTARTENA
ncbi:hypothetical protein GCM10022206_14400 [Streptomyces chiangmaiensis]